MRSTNHGVLLFLSAYLIGTVFVSVVAPTLGKWMAGGAAPIIVVCIVLLSMGIKR